MPSCRNPERRIQLIELFERSPVQRSLGTRLHYDDADDAVVTFARNVDFDNALGATHGGILTTLLDTAGWFAVAPAYASWIVTVDLHVQLLIPATGDTLTAVGHRVRTGSRLAMARMSVLDAGGSEVAVGQGTFSVTRADRSS